MEEIDAKRIWGDAIVAAVAGFVDAAGGLSGGKGKAPRTGGNLLPAPVPTTNRPRGMALLDPRRELIR